VAASPVLGASRRLDEAKAMAIRRAQIVNLGDVVAVWPTTLAAKQGLAALAIRWDDGPNAGVTTADVVRGLDAASQQTGVVAGPGQVADALRGAAQKSTQ